MRLSASRLCRFLAALPPLLALPAAAQDTAAVRLPDLRGATAVTISDGWRGYSPASPVGAEYTLGRDGGRFTGQAVLAAGGGDVRREERHALSLPVEVVEAFLDSLARVPVRGGAYRPEQMDDYTPELDIVVVLAGQEIRFHSSSARRGYVPWRVRWADRAYVTDSDVAWRALEFLRPHLLHHRLRALVDDVIEDPEARCRTGIGMSEPEPASAPRLRVYAGDADWFLANEPIELHGRRYVKYGLDRVLSMQEITPAGEYRGVTVYAEVGGARPPQVIYVPTTARCVVQAYVSDLLLRGVRG